MLEKQFVVAFLCICMAVTIPASRKEDLERAAELAVERAAERAAERAVEKALEAGNTTSTTITVKESYSNAKEIAEEQAAPGSESTRSRNSKTSVYESKDIDENHEYKPDYANNNDSNDYSDYDLKGSNGFNESMEYSDFDSSKGNTGYYKKSIDYRKTDPRDSGDYSDSIEYDDSASKSYKDYNDSKNPKSPKEHRESEDYRIKDHIRFSSDHRKVNTSKSFQNPEIPFQFGGFDWSPNYSNSRSKFEKKLSTDKNKFGDRTLASDSGFHSTKVKFSKGKDSMKNKRDESWKPYSNWQKDDKLFSKILFWNNGDGSHLEKRRPLWDTLSNESENIGVKTFKSPIKGKYNFWAITSSWQPNDEHENSRSRVAPSYSIHTSRGNGKKKDILSDKVLQKIMERYPEGSEGRFENRSTRQSKKRSKEPFKTEAEEQYNERLIERFKKPKYERVTEKLVVQKVPEEFNIPIHRPLTARMKVPVPMKEYLNVQVPVPVPVPQTHSIENKMAVPGNTQGVKNLFSENSERYRGNLRSPPRFRVPTNEAHQDEVMNDQLITMAIPQFFPRENIQGSSKNFHPVPIQKDVNKPYTINTDKAISMALNKRIPFIISVPSQVKETY